MTDTLMIFQAAVSVLMIILVLLQFGKGAEAGLMGGSSDSVFTGSQQGNILSKMTAVLAVIFMANSVFLAKIQSERTDKSLLESASPLSSNPLSSEAPGAAAPATPAKDAKKKEDVKK